MEKNGVKSMFIILILVLLTCTVTFMVLASKGGQLMRQNQEMADKLELLPAESGFENLRSAGVDDPKGFLIGSLKSNEFRLADDVPVWFNLDGEGKISFIGDRWVIIREKLGGAEMEVLLSYNVSGRDERGNPRLDWKILDSRYVR